MTNQKCVFFVIQITFYETWLGDFGQKTQIFHIILIIAYKNRAKHLI